jgi:hypothetical protein
MGLTKQELVLIGFVAGGFRLVIEQLLLLVQVALPNWLILYTSTYNYIIYNIIMTLRVSI